MPGLFHVLFKTEDILNLLEGIYAELREGMNQYDLLVTNLVAIQNRVHQWIDLFFPDLYHLYPGEDYSHLILEPIHDTFAVKFLYDLIGAKKAVWLNYKIK